MVLRSNPEVTPFIAGAGTGPDSKTIGAYQNSPYYQQSSKLPGTGFEPWEKEPSQRGSAELFRYRELLCGLHLFITTPKDYCHFTNHCCPLKNRGVVLKCTQLRATHLAVNALTPEMRLACLPAAWKMYELQTSPAQAGGGGLRGERVRIPWFTPWTK